MATSTIRRNAGYSTATLTPEAGWTVNTNYVHRNANGVCEFYIEISGGSYGSLNAWNTVATLPEGFRPSVGYDTIMLDNGRVGYGVDIKVQTDGQIKIYPDANTTRNIRLRGVFLA